MEQQETNEAIHELVKVGDWIRWASSQFSRFEVFFGHGTDNAWDEAVALVLHALYLPHDAAPEVFETRVTTSERQRIMSLIKERIEARKPLAYLTHQAWFAGLPFYVDERVIVPRSPFGEWIKKRFTPWIIPEQVTDILEVGTGSGCMAIAAAFAFPHAKVDAVDLSSEALEVAKINVKKYQLEDRINLIQSDCFKALPNKNYDVIMSNPPYVSAEEMKVLPPEYLKEPQMAFLAQDHGLAMVENLLKHADPFLKKSGILVIEVGDGQVALESRYNKVPFTWLEQEYGGYGLLLLTKEELVEFK